MLNKYLQFFRWGMTFKLYMAIYTLGILFFQIFCRVVQGQDTISVWHIIQMTLVGLGTSLVQMLCFPENRELAGGALRARTFIWFLVSNGLIIGGALGFGWFSPLPGWAAACLVAALELALFFMWVGVHLALRADTQRLNNSLRAFQHKVG